MKTDMWNILIISITVFTYNRSAEGQAEGKKTAAIFNANMIIRKSSKMCSQA